MDIEKAIWEYADVLDKRVKNQDVSDFFEQHRSFRKLDGYMIRPKYFRKLEEKFSKSMVITYFSHYFQLVIGKEKNLSLLEAALWDTAQLSIAEYLCKNGKVESALPPLFTCIDYLAADLPSLESKTLELDAFFWNSYNRGIAYEDNSLFSTGTSISFLPSFLFNQPLGHKEISRKYLHLIGNSSIPREIKEKYIHKLQKMEAFPRHAFYLQE